jgi:phage gpG-like protein
VVRIDWDVYGEDLISRELLRFEARNLNAMPVFMAVIEDLKDYIGKQFGSEGHYASGGWAQLKDSTIESKIAGGYPTTILHRTLNLLRSFVDESHSDYEADAHPYGFTYGSRLEYGRFHQTGFTSPSGEPVPARPPLEFREVDKVLVMKRIQRYLVTGELGAGAVS